MSKNQGQTAQPEKSAMKMGGCIRLALEPKILSKLIAGESVNVELGSFENRDNVELVLQLKPGIKNEILELDPYFNIDEAAVTIRNSVEEDEEADVLEYFQIAFQEREGRCLHVMLNQRQAAALIETLAAYIGVCDRIQKLQQPPVPISPVPECLAA